VAKRAATSAAVDPLAALDELGADEEAQDLVYPTELAKGGGGAVGLEPAPLESVAASPVAPKPAKPEAAKPEAAKPEAAKPEAAKPAPKPAEPAPAPAPAAATESKTPEAEAAKPKAKGRFTLQISSFQSRAEADAFLAKLPATSHKPYIVQSEVPGKGTYFRVRMGEFGSNDEAVAAKSAFETSHHIIAYVTKL